MPGVTIGHMFKTRKIPSLNYPGIYLLPLLPMLTLPEATRLALHVRGLFALFEQHTLGKEWTILDLASGCSIDCADLLRLVMAKEGLRKIDDIDAKLEHELCDVLWSVLVIADRYSVDLSKAFPDQMKALENLIQAKLQ